MNQKRLLHLDWYPALNASWILRVLSVLHACKSPALKERFSRWDRDQGQGLTLGDLAFAVATKLTMVPLIVQRVDARLKDIETILQSDPMKVEACLQKGAVYNLPDRHFAQEAIVEFDSFLFESRSAYEITVSFLQRFFHLILEKRLGAGSKDAARHVEEVLQYRGAQTHWVNVMRKKRNLLIHSRATLLAFEVSDVDPFRFDPVLLTKSVERVEDDPDRLSVEQCRSIWRGFVSSYEHIETWLIEEVTTAEARAR
jgi:hypothetical protein